MALVGQRMQPFPMGGLPHSQFGGLRPQAAMGSPATQMRPQAQASPYQMPATSRSGLQMPSAAVPQQPGMLFNASMSSMATQQYGGMQQPMRGQQLPVPSNTPLLGANVPSADGGSSCGRSVQHSNAVGPVSNAVVAAPTRRMVTPSSMQGSEIPGVTITGAASGVDALSIEGGSSAVSPGSVAAAAAAAAAAAQAHTALPGSKLSTPPQPHQNGSMRRSASLEERRNQNRPQEDPHGDGFYLATTGYKGAKLTVPKYSKHLREWTEHQLGDSAEIKESRPKARSLSPVRSKNQAILEPRRTSDRCHADLYEDAHARTRRIEDICKYVQKQKDDEHSQRMAKYEMEMRERRKTYRGKLSGRSILEHQQEWSEKRRTMEADKVAVMKREKEQEELKECTFRPCFNNKKGKRPQSPSRENGGLATSGGSKLSLGGGDKMSFDAVQLSPRAKLGRLVDKQRQTTLALKELSAEDAQLKDRLRQVHAELYDKIQREETQRVVAMLQESEESTNQKSLIQRVRRMVEAGDDPEQAQKHIVEELVVRSQDEVRRRVLEAFGPKRIEAETELYSRRLALVHELEVTEAKMVALSGGALVDEAKATGFEFGLAERVRRSMPAVPSPPSLWKSNTPTQSEIELPTANFLGRSLLAASASAGSSLIPTPHASPRMPEHRRPLTPRSQGGTPRSPAFQVQQLPEAMARLHSPSRQTSVNEEGAVTGMMQAQKASEAHSNTASQASLGAAAALGRPASLPPGSPRTATKEPSQETAGNSALVGMVLHVRILSAHKLKNTDISMLGGGVSDPYVVAKMGKTIHKTPTINNNLNPVWATGNDFFFKLGEADQKLDLQVFNSNVIRDDSLGTTSLDVRTLQPGKLYRRREPLSDSQDGALEFQARIMHPEAASAEMAAAAAGTNGATKTELDNDERRSTSPLSRPATPTGGASNSVPGIAGMALLSQHPQGGSSMLLQHQGSRPSIISTSTPPAISPAVSPRNSIAAFSPGGAVGQPAMAGPASLGGSGCGSRPLTPTGMGSMSTIPSSPSGHGLVMPTTPPGMAASPRRSAPGGMIMNPGQPASPAAFAASPGGHLIPQAGMPGVSMMHRRSA